MICSVGYALNPKKLRKSGLDGTTLQSEATVSSLPSSGSSLCPTSSAAIWRGGGLADIISGGLECEGVKFIPWNYEVPIALQPEFHVIIHKLTEDIDRAESLDKIKALKRYLQHYPDTVIVDSLDAVRRVISRARSCESLAKIIKKLDSNCPFTQPGFFVVESEEESSVKNILELMCAKGICFPVMCKPVEACGTPNSHRMVVVLSSIGFESMAPPFIVQEYKDHNEFFFKVYVMDDEVMIFRRPSLPNLDDLAVAAGNRRNLHTTHCVNSNHSNDSKVPNHSNNSNNKCDCLVDLELDSSLYTGMKSVAFDSRYAYPTGRDFQLDSDYTDAGTNTGSASNNLNGKLNTCLNGNSNHSNNSNYNSNAYNTNVNSIGSIGSSSSGNNNHNNHSGNNDTEIKSGRDRVLSVEGRAKKPSAKDMPLCESSSPTFISLSLRSSSFSTASPLLSSIPSSLPPISLPCSLPSSLLSFPSLISSTIQFKENKDCTDHGKERSEDCTNQNGQVLPDVYLIDPPAVLGADSGPVDFRPAAHSVHCTPYITSNSNNGNSNNCDNSNNGSVMKNNGSFNSKMNALNIDEDRFRAAAMAIKEEFGLSLFGFDMIVPVMRHREEKVTKGEEEVEKVESLRMEIKRKETEVEEEKDVKEESFTEEENETWTVINGNFCGSSSDHRTCDSIARISDFSDITDNHSDNVGLSLEPSLDNRGCTINTGNIAGNRVHKSNVYDREELDLLVIDVNYFPSYKEVPDFPQKLRRFLRQKANMPPIISA